MKSRATLLAILSIFCCYGQDSSDTKRWFEPTTLDTSFYFSNDIQLTLKFTDSIFINEYFMDNRVIDSLTKPYNNRHVEALEIETYLLQTNSNIAKRDSNGLYIKLKNEEWKLLAPDPKTEETDHTFEHYFKEFGYYSVRVQWGEGNGYKLINFSDGTITNLIGRPYFSPDGRYVISVSVDIEAGYSQNGFQLFTNKDGRLQHLGDYKPSAWGPVSVKWLDRNRLVLKNETVEYNNGHMKYMDFYAELKIKNGG